MIYFKKYRSLCKKDQRDIYNHKNTCVNIMCETLLLPKFSVMLYIYDKYIYIYIAS